MSRFEKMLYANGGPTKQHVKWLERSLIAYMNDDSKEIAAIFDEIIEQGNN